MVELDVTDPAEVSNHLVNLAHQEGRLRVRFLIALGIFAISLAASFVMCSHAIATATETRQLFLPFVSVVTTGVLFWISDRAQVRLSDFASERKATAAELTTPRTGRY